ncbi:antitoxin [Candidatus Woesearchaeota archaeon RBG_13_36_6]|nr:MAG: antitoxin [Candidatus Woesearchaeota archaeon RBG_13_36_6]
MVQAIVKFGEYQDRILTIVKGKFGLKNKTEAVNFVIQKYGEDLLEPELRPEYVKKLKRIEKEKTIQFKSLDELRALIENA